MLSDVGDAVCFKPGNEAVFLPIACGIEESHDKDKFGLVVETMASEIRMAGLPR